MSISVVEQQNDNQQCPDKTSYTIRPGDSLFSLAQRFNTPLEDIINANPNIDPTLKRFNQNVETEMLNLSKIFFEVIGNQK